MKIIKQRERKTKVRYYLSFEWSDTPGCGFNFDCDKKGNVLTTSANNENYQKCISGEYDVINEGIQKSEWSYTEPAIGRCSCGEEVVLDSFTNTCDECERDYNSQGNLLAPRECWGEEQGNIGRNVISKINEGRMCHMKKLTLSYMKNILPKEEIPFSIDMWYNRPERAWVIQIKDEDNCQIGDSVYVGTKPEALNQVKRWKEEYGIPLIRT